MSCKRPVKMLFIGASTGGTEALHVLLAGLYQEAVNLPVAVALHLPPGYGAALVKGLMQSTHFSCQEAVNGQKAEPGTAYFAPPQAHLQVVDSPSGLSLKTEVGPPIDFCLPSVNALFTSAAAQVGGQAVGIVLTGMGTDGTQGARAMAAKGAKIFIQDETTSVVWGMPGSIVQAGISYTELKLERLAPRLAKYIREQRD